MSKPFYSAFSQYAVRFAQAAQAQAILTSTRTIRILPQPHLSSVVRTRLQSSSTRKQRYHTLRTSRKSPTRRNYSSEPPKPDITPQLGSPDARLSLRERLRKLFKEYGYVSVGVYLALSVADFPFCFLAVRLAGPERIGQIEHSILTSIKGVTDPVWKVIGPVAGPAIDTTKETVARIWKGAKHTAGVEPEGSSAALADKSGHEAASIWTQLALAYGIHKTLLIFVRVPLTAALTPRVARTLRSWGWKIGSKSTP